VRSEIAFLYEVVEPSDKFIKAVCNAIAVELFRALGRKPTFADNFFDGAVGGSIVVKVFSHRPTQFVAVALRESDAAMNGRRPQINQQSAGLEYTMRFSKGIDHAPV